MATGRSCFCCCYPSNGKAMLGVVGLLIVATCCYRGGPPRSVHGFVPSSRSTTTNPIFIDRAGAGGAAIFTTTPRRTFSRRLQSDTIEEDEDDGEDFHNDLYDNNDISFDDLGVSPPLQRCAQSMGWKTPTPIQRLAIPAILNNDDHNHNSVWCEAPTGSGKTGGYALPLLQCLLRDAKNSNDDRSSQSRQHKVKSLVLVPTRELALQIGEVLTTLRASLPRPMQATGLRGDVVVLHGGVPLGPQMDALMSGESGSGCDVLVATPGRLVDLVRHYQTTNAKQEREGALERRLLEALDTKSRRGSADATLTQRDLEEANLNSATMTMTNDGDKGDDNLNLSNMLNRVQYLVVDEADRLLGHAFQKELDPLLDMLPNAKKKRRRADNDENADADDADAPHNNMKVMLFSATFPEEIQIRVQRVLERLNGRETPPLRLSCTEHDASSTTSTSSTSTSQQKTTSTTTTNTPSSLIPPNITLRTVRLREADRTRALRRLLDEHDPQWDRVLVFVSTRYLAEHVARKLRRANVDAVELHGKLDQDTRRKRLRRFVSGSGSTKNSGKVSVLLATDLASRGLDIPGLPAVVNYDLPRSTADFTHRVGRTGRAGRSGEAVTFVTAKDEAHYDLIERRQLAFLEKKPVRESWLGFEIDEDEWQIRARASHEGAPGAVHSSQGLTFDKMHGGVKSARRKSKKDKLREEEQQQQQVTTATEVGNTTNV